MKPWVNLKNPMRQIFLNRKTDNSRAKRYLCWQFALAGFWMIFSSLTLYSQYPFERTAPSKYRIVFKDKLNSAYAPEAPGEFLSPKALERRQRQNIPIVAGDLPVTRAYLDSIATAGASILHVSKWFNSATIEVEYDSVLENIARFSFIESGTKTGVYTGQTHTSYRNIMETAGNLELDYGPSWWQTAIHNGQLLHNNGFTGRDMVIAVLDAGFSHVDTLPAFNQLFEKGRILGTRDFVEPGNNVYLEATHGMSVLSIMGGFQQGELIGTAPDASFWLLRSEDGASEFIIEEDNWIAAAEFADSVGADIINTSLGYSVFNDSLQNHTYGDMDGNTTRISRAADIAASKGMLVVVSAGNQGNAEWKYITAPADADSVLTIGAVDRSRLISTFSSRGPSSDQEIKPNVVALGQGIFAAYSDGSIRQGNGTSYSAPVISGLAACLWQANPESGAMDLYKAISESADRFYHPDIDYGHGIPDFNLANVLLKASRQGHESAKPVMAFPSPFYNQLYIFFESPVSTPVDITLYDTAGKEIFQKTYQGVTERKYLVIDNDFDRIQKGVYIIRIRAGNLSGNTKLVRY
jgi:subtilisin family serine protease